MPIDARIPLGVQPIAIKPPMQSLRDAMVMREAVGTFQDNERKRKEDTDIREAIRATGGDLEKALPQIRQINPTYGIAVENQLSEQKTRALQLQNAHLAQRINGMQFIGQAIGGAKDQPTWDAAVGNIYQAYDAMQIPRPALPQAYDANTVKTLQSQALTVQQQLEEQRRQQFGEGATERERALSRYAARLGTTVDKLTDEQERRFKTQYDATSGDQSKYEQQRAAYA